MASSIVSSAAKELGSLVVGEVKYLYEVSDKIERLQRDLLWMRCFLEDADNKEHRQKVVGMWVSEIRDFGYEAQEIIEWYVHQVAHHRRNGKCNTVKWFSCCLCDAPSLHDVGSRIDGLRSRISESISNLRLCGVQMTELGGAPQYNLAMREKRRTYSHTKEYSIGLENHIQEVVKQLVERNEVKVVGIFGIGGLGKTTLARQIFSDKAVKEYFGSNCVWVYISKQFERKTIFQEILLGLKCTSAGKDDNKDDKARTRLEKLRDKDDNKDYNTRNIIEKLREEELLEEIRKVLKEKKCLVVLDDMWRNVDWNTLMPAFDSIKDYDSKILITTRNKSLVEHAARECPRGYSYPLGFLSRGDSWKLLERILFSIEESSGKKEKAPSHDTKSNKATSKEEGQDEAPTLGIDQIDQTKIPGNKELTSFHDTRNNNTTSKGGQGKKDTTSPHDTPNNKGATSKEEGQVGEAPTLRRHQTDETELHGNKEIASSHDTTNSKTTSKQEEQLQDREIEAEELFHLWEAEGLVTASLDGGDELQDVLLDDIAGMYLNQLVERSMIQVEKSWSNGRIRSCRLHDIMRDMCLKKCKEGNFLHIIEHDSSTNSSNEVVRACSLNRRMRRCALHGSANSGSLVDPSLRNSTPCIRSLLVFPDGNEQPRKVLSRKMRKFFSLLRVLYLPDAEILSFPTVLGDFIHVRFLCLRGADFFDLPRRIWDCKYLETLDLQDCWIRSLSNKFWKLERLRHLYLPILALKGSQKLDLTITQLRQMETYKEFDVEKCRIADLQEMTKLRNFSFNGRQVSKEDLKVLLTSPMITSKRLVNPLSLRMQAGVINEDPSIFARMMSQDIHISELDIGGRIEVPLGGSVNANVQIFPHTLVHLELNSSEISKEGISILGKLPLLEDLGLTGELSGGDHKMSFCDGSFPSLDTLKLWGIGNMEEWEVGKDALPNLHFLYIWDCGALKLIPEGLPKSVQVACDPCIQGIKKYGTCRYLKDATPSEPDPSKSLKEHKADFVYPLKDHFYSCQRSVCLM